MDAPGTREAAARSGRRVIRLDLQYVGTEFAGWQVQPGKRTVQGAVQDALAEILGGTVKIIGAGRTDAGVHARGQVASFVTASGRTCDVIRRAANARLPGDVRVMRASEAGEGFHALASATGKDYRYSLWTGEVMPPFRRRFAAHCPGPLDADRFAEAARAVIGNHDFSAFASAGGSASDPVRTVTRSDLTRDGDLWVYRVAADGFLYKMVRTLVGTLVEIARGRWDPGAITEILESKDRTRAGPAMPPEGLVLHTVYYDG